MLCNIQAYLSRVEEDFVVTLFTRWQATELCMWLLLFFNTGILLNNNRYVKKVDFREKWIQRIHRNEHPLLALAQGISLV